MARKCAALVEKNGESEKTLVKSREMVYRKCSFANDTVEVLGPELVIERKATGEKIAATESQQEDQKWPLQQCYYDNNFTREKLDVSEMLMAKKGPLIQETD